VVELDHMGTPGRSKAFHDYYFGNMGDNGIPDHIVGIKQLAARHRFIDIEKVGIYGHSGGGFASTDAILRYPDFFKVAVSGAGNHDNRTYGFFWGEKYQGLLKKTPDGKDNSRRPRTTRWPAISRASCCSCTVTWTTTCTRPTRFGSSMR
jgi:dipeptidyl aminopeptidase/acylaminoacyl peptidase